MYCSDIPFSEYYGKILLIKTPKSHRDRPINASKVRLDILLPPNHQDQDPSTWNITRAVENLNI